MASHLKLGCKVVNFVSYRGNTFRTLPYPVSDDPEAVTCEHVEGAPQRGDDGDGVRRCLRQKGHNTDETGPLSASKVGGSLDGSSAEEEVPASSTPVHHTSGQVPGGSKGTEQLAKKKGVEMGGGGGKRCATFQKCQFEQHLDIPVSVDSDGSEDHQMEGTAQGMGASVSLAGGETVPLVEQKRLISLFTTVIKATEQSSIEDLEHIHSMFEHLIFRSRFELNKTCLLDVSQSLQLTQYANRI